jgi:hypothetical protein
MCFCDVESTTAWRSVRLECIFPDQRHKVDFVMGRFEKASVLDERPRNARHVKVPRSGKRKKSAETLGCSVLDEVSARRDFIRILPLFASPLFSTFTHQPPHDAFTNIYETHAHPIITNAHTSRSRPNEFTHACYILITRHSAQASCRPSFATRHPAPVTEIESRPTVYLQPQAQHETLLSPP